MANDVLGPLILLLFKGFGVESWVVQWSIAVF